MDYIKLERLVTKRNDYLAKRTQLIDDIDFQNAIVENELKLYIDDKEIFIEAIKECYTKIIVDLEHEINELTKQKTP